MTLFSLLLSETEVHLAPGEKIIPQETVAKVFDLKHLQELVREEAQAYRVQVDEECQQLREEARQEGFASGEKTWAGAVADLERGAEGIRQEVEAQMVPAVIKAVERIIQTKLKMDPDIITSIVGQSLKSVMKYRTITIYCRKEDVAALEEAKPKYKKMLEQCETLTIQERNDIEPGGCIIETEGGIVNAQLASQLKALEQAMKKAQGSS